METEREQDLWRIAKKRVAFKRHFVMYIIINSLFWVLWMYSGGHAHSSPWPLWPMLGWGIGLAFSYFDAYGLSQTGAVEKEYQRLKQKQGKD